MLSTIEWKERYSCRTQCMGLFFRSAWLASCARRGSPGSNKASDSDGPDAGSGATVIFIDGPFEKEPAPCRV